MMSRENARRYTCVSALALVSTVVLVLSSCGGGASSSNSGPVTQPSPSVPGLSQSVNHIIFMAQENRGFDHYFGKLADYWAANGFPPQSFDGLPANASNPGGLTPTGQLATDQTPADRRYTEYFVEGTEPLALKANPWKLFGWGPVIF